MGLTRNQRRLLNSLRSSAKEQLRNHALTKKELEALGRTFSGPLGELYACDKLKLKWCPGDGHDARTGRTRYEIKTRRPSIPDGKFKNSYTGRFKGTSFEIGLLVELDYEFEVDKIYQMSKTKVMRLQKEGSKRGIRLRKFRSESKEVFTRR